MNPRQLSHELRNEISPDLKRRRWIFGLSMVGIAAGKRVSLYQMGMIACLAASTQHRIAIFPGGVPLEVDGKVVGAVGASGGKPDQDHAVAKAGADAFPTARST